MANFPVILMPCARAMSRPPAVFAGRQGVESAVLAGDGTGTVFGVAGGLGYGVQQHVAVAIRVRVGRTPGKDEANVAMEVNTIRLGTQKPVDRPGN